MVHRLTTPLLIAAALACACTHADELLESTELVVTVRDADTNELLPARLVLVHGGAPLRIGELDMWQKRQSRGYCDLGDGVIGTWDGISLAYGEASIPIGRTLCGALPEIPYGEYSLWIFRGIEWEAERYQVDLRRDRGLVVVDAHLSRAFTPTRTLSADLHVHADNSNDSLVPARVRVISQAAAGIQVVGLTEHNYNADLGDAIAELGMGDVIASLPGTEVTPDHFHFGLFPAVVDCSRPRCGALGAAELADKEPEEVLALLRALPGGPFILVNHPRFATGSLFTTKGWKTGTWPPPFPLDFDGLEVLSSLTAFNEPDDDRLDVSVNDFYTLIDHGVLVTALGNSDTHHLNWVLDGSSRNYVYAQARGVQELDDRLFVDALRARRVVATTGPWLSVVANGVGPGETADARTGSVDLEVRLAQASFVHADTVRVLVGGEVFTVLELNPLDHEAAWHLSVPVPADTWIGVDASGTTPLPPMVTGSYHIDRGRAGIVPFAIINPILVDRDGDGQVELGR